MGLDRPLSKLGTVVWLILLTRFISACHRSSPSHRDGPQAQGGREGTGRNSFLGLSLHEVGVVSTNSPEVLLGAGRAVAHSGPAGAVGILVPLQEGFVPRAPAVSARGVKFSGASEGAWLWPGV